MQDIRAYFASGKFSLKNRRTGLAVLPRWLVKDMVKGYHSAGRFDGMLPLDVPVAPPAHPAQLTSAAYPSSRA